MEQSFTLFLFQPAPGWEYCGGATLICADTVEEAVQIAQQHLGTIYSSSDRFTTEVVTRVDTDADVCLWSFVRSFTLVEPMDVGIVFEDSNYA